MRAHILTIGTEIVTGEIVNTNAAWLSQQLESHGYSVQSHLSVRDDKAAIAEALKFASNANVFFVTGGLGPTSDDLTRETVAAWLGKPLVFSEPVWVELAAIYERRGLPLREAHRHQCYFPKGSLILSNPVGTAHGFRGKKGKTEIYVLPGPPQELIGMWTTAVLPNLRPGREPLWHHWSILGVPESEVAETVEPIIAGRRLETGYRASVPYVHLKVRGSRYNPELEETLNEAFSRWTVFKGNQDFAEEFFRGLSGKHILFQDQVTRGALGARLHPLARKFEEIQWRIEECYGEEPFLCTTKGVYAQILRVPEDEMAFEIVWRDHKNIQRAKPKLPYGLKVTSERGAKSVTEWALFNWWKWNGNDKNKL